MRVYDNLDYRMAEEICNFIKKFKRNNDQEFRKQYIPEYYLWKITKNPNGNGLVTVALDGDKLIGIVTITRKKVIYRGEIVSAGELGDGFTDPQYQGNGIFSKLLRQTIERTLALGIELIYGTPNKVALPIEIKCGFIKVNTTKLYLWVFPLSVDVYKKSFNEIWIASATVKIIDYFFSMVVKIFNFGNRHKGKMYIESVDYRFSELDGYLERKYKIRVSREESQYRYRIADNPDSEYYKILSLRDLENMLVSVLTFKECFQRGLRTLFVADIFGKSIYSQNRLWRKAILYAINNEFQMIAMWRTLSFENLITMLPFVPIPIERKTIIVYNNAIGEKISKDGCDWLFSIIDSDNI